jgi:hypothetical protein
VSWGLLVDPADVVTSPEDDGAYWVIHKLRERNFPPTGDLRTRPANTNILWSGMTQSGKSTTAAKLIFGFGDQTFLPSLKNHVAFSGDITTAWRCHISISPFPLFQALKHDLRVLTCNGADDPKTGLPADRCAEYRGPRLQPSHKHLMFDGRELPAGSWWLLDEPTDVNALDYWDVIIRAFTDLVTMYAFMGVNLACMTPVKDTVTGKLQNLTHLWMRQKRPGRAEVWAMTAWMNTKGRAKRKEFMQPRYKCTIVDEGEPPQIWRDLYPTIKTFNADAKTDQWMVRLAKKGYIT